ncbi:MAG TPA: ABC transporter ATP-binding protein [Ktedonobacterales bacterium]|nr:ABC transporter ATP-binding protein [Ktedonobacterales bacterium]
MTNMDELLAPYAAPARPARDDDVVVRLAGLRKQFGAVRAVDGVSLDIRRGETVALLGPNGAGKTTTIAMLLGLLAPTAGTVEAFGTSPAEAIQTSRIGAMLQEGKLMSGVRIGEFIEFVRGLHPAPLAYAHLIELAGLGGLEGRRLDRLSGGQTQRVRFAMAIAGNPEMLVLDEPTAAMDVEARREFWDGMHRYAALGHTILFATHYLEEAESSASRVVIIAGGRVITDGTVAEIQARYGATHVTFSAPGAAAEGYARLPGVRSVAAAGARVTLATSDADATVRALVAGSAPWRDLAVARSSLEDIFVELVRQGKDAVA